MPLTSHANVENTCLRILRDRGFKLTLQGCESGSVGYLWIAEKDGFRFTAENAIELLGLVAIFDHVKPKEDTPYWWSVKGPDVRRELMAAAEAKAAGKEQLEGRGSKDRAV